MRGALGPALLAAGLVYGTLCAASSLGPLLGRTGAPALGTHPAEPTCNDAGCHSGNPLNVNGVLEIQGPRGYVPGSTYTIVVRLTSSANQASPVRRWGFQLTAVSEADGTGAGSFFSPTLLVSRSDPKSGGRPYISHDIDTLMQGAASPVQWSFTWTAPDRNVGTVGLYAAGNAANGDQNNTGDTIYTASATVPVSPTPAQPATWGGLKARFVRAEDRAP